jgi:hypothetical protein
MRTVLSFHLDMAQQSRKLSRLWERAPHLLFQHSSVTVVDTLHFTAPKHKMIGRTGSIDTHTKNEAVPCKSL